MVDTSIPHRGYWQAQGMVDLALSSFEAAAADGRAQQQRGAFFRLARYHGRTLRVLNSGLHRNDEPLAQAALHNLSALHRGMVHMHRAAPDLIPLPVALSVHSRGDFLRDLIMRVLAETPPALRLADVHQRANHLDLLGGVPEAHLEEHLDALVRARHVAASDGGFVRTNHPYVELNKDVAALRALIGRTFFAKFAAAGYDSLRTIGERVQPFKALFPELTGFSEPYTMDLFVNVVHMLLDTSVSGTTVWRYNDLLHSPYPRPYQWAAFDAFRRGDYQRQVIDAPTGSGKTFVGLMCIQDWLRTLDIGESILVLVPTSNYQQQWIDELCHNPIGLQLPPEIIFSGTPGDLNRFQQLTGAHPAILVLTYTALSQLGTPKGKGGFDVQSVEVFLQQANVQHVMLDEVHKVVEDMHAVAADVTRLLVAWQKDTSLRSLIGFSGTAVAYRSRFEALDLSIPYAVPIEDLVAAGFVAPFAELGVPFAYSERERRIRELLEAYKDGLQRCFDLLGPARIRAWFAELPDEVRTPIGHDILGMYRGRADWRQAIARRFREWESGGADAIKLSEARMLTIIQVANAWSDGDLAREAGADAEAFAVLTAELEALKAELSGLVYLPKTLSRLQRAGFTSVVAAEQIRALPASGESAAARRETVKDLLSTTIVGLYDGLSEWYLRTGEGRVATIKAVMEAEQAARPVSGVIIFDTGRHIPWRQGLSIPGYQGLAGLFTELLGDGRFTVMAALSNEMYLSYDADDPVTERIAAFIGQELMAGEVGRAIFNLLVAGLDLNKGARAELDAAFFELLENFLPTLAHMHAARPGAFNRAVLRPLRRLVKQMKLGLDGDRLVARMDRRNVHLRGLVQTLFDYALLAVHFREAHAAEVEQVSGARQRFFAVTMPSGARRKQLMYDLTARIVDAESLPVNVVIVSNWARTGWNVIQPNLLIDATATRNVTAWQQLRGRAIRAWRTWNNDCYRLLSVLVGHHLLEEEEEAAAEDGVLDAALQTLLAGITTGDQQARFLSGGVHALDDAERQQLAVRLMEQRNKVTHIYELVKASGSTSQVVYDRGERLWHRRDNIAAKHEREVSVNPFTGQKSAGDGHAPLVYAQDPRTDVPAELQRHLLEQIAGCDDVIVGGWLGNDAVG